MGTANSETQVPDTTEGSEVVDTTPLFPTAEERAAEEKPKRTRAPKAVAVDSEPSVEEPRRPMIGEFVQFITEHSVLPALVTNVHGATTVNLLIFPDAYGEEGLGRMPFYRSSVQLQDEGYYKTNCWRWVQ